jgi:hypothetical protein
MTIAEHRFDNAKRRRPEHHARQAMLTPPYVLEPVRQLLGGIELDPCMDRMKMSVKRIGLLLVDWNGVGVGGWSNRVVDLQRRAIAQLYLAGGDDGLPLLDA